MKVFFIGLITLLFAGCGGVGEIERFSGELTTDGKPIMEKSTEAIEVAEQFAAAMEHVQPQQDMCAKGLTAEQIAALKEGGQQMYFMSKLVCVMGVNMANAVKSARDLPTTSAGEVAHASQKAISSIEATDAQESASNANMAARIATGGFVYLGFKAMADRDTGDTYGDVNIQGSNSGDHAGGEGAGGQAGDRNMAINVGNGTINQQPGDSNTMATAEKATSVDNPIVSGGPENAIVNDSDGGNSGSLF